LDLSFSQTNSHDITILNTKAAVKASVKNIILTERGSAIFQPYYGTSLSKYLFEVADNNLGNEILEEIRTSLTLWENRVIIEKIEVILEDDNITLSVYLEYTIKQLEETDSFTVNLVRDR
jgi:phage baseplate assembly protein W